MNLEMNLDFKVCMFLLFCYLLWSCGRQYSDQCLFS